MRLVHGAAFCALVLPAALPAVAQVADPFGITEAEKAACQTDATRLCSETYPDVTRLLACMKTNRSVLSPSCRRVFDAGLKRRGLS